MIGGSKTIQGCSSGIATDSEDTLHFAELSSIRPMIEKFPVAKVHEAYARMTVRDSAFITRHLGLDHQLTMLDERA